MATLPAILLATLSKTRRKFSPNLDWRWDKEGEEESYAALIWTNSFLIVLIRCCLYHYYVLLWYRMDVYLIQSIKQRAQSPLIFFVLAIIIAYYDSEWMSSWSKWSKEEYIFWFKFSLMMLIVPIICHSCIHCGFRIGIFLIPSIKRIVCSL